MSDSTSTPETESTPDSAPGSDATNDQVDPGSDWDGDATSHGIIPPDSWSHTPDRDVDEFYLNEDGTRTLAGPGDLKATVPNHDSEAMDELERYWLDKPYSYCVIYHSKDKNEHLYYVVEPHLDDDEQRLKQFFDNQIQNNIRYDDVPLNPTELEQQRIIRDTFYELLQRYSMVRRGDLSGDAGVLSRGLDRFASFLKRRTDKRRANRDTLVSPPSLSDSDSRDDGDTISGRLTPHQVAKLAYYLIRDSVGRDKIEPLKQDRRIEDVNCDAPGVEVFIDHAEHEQLITNIEFQEDELDRLIEKLANRAGKGISRRQPTVDATLPDGARAQLTLSDETTTKGSNFTIRQFRDVPFTPVDLISWETYSLDQLAYLWLCIESGKSVIFAGGTSSGKTTTLNALSLFIPGAAEKIVSIEDTPELELPQKNWIQQTTREPFAQDGADAIEEIDLLTTALRQNPDYIVMGEVRSEEGSVLFQGMSSGHTCFTTFHASNPSQVIKRFVSDDIGVSREFFNELDIIVNQQEVRVDDEKVRRNTRITEIGAYEQESNRVRRRQLFTWDAHSDSFIQSSPSNLLEEIREGRGWSMARMEWELLKRQAVLAYLAANNIQSYRAVATTIQAVLSEEVNILKLIADRELQDRLDDLSEMRSVHLDVSEEEEESVPRPDIPEGVREDAEEVLDDVMPYLQQMKLEAEKDDEAATGQRSAAQHIPEVRDASVTDRLEGSRAVDIEWTSPKVDDDVEGATSTSRPLDGVEASDVSLDDLDPEAREILMEYREAAAADAQAQPSTGDPDEADRESSPESPDPDDAGSPDGSDTGSDPAEADTGADSDTGDDDEDKPSPEFEINTSSKPDDPFAAPSNGTGEEADASSDDDADADSEEEAASAGLGSVYDSSMGPDPEEALDTMRESVDGISGAPTSGESAPTESGSETDDRSTHTSDDGDDGDDGADDTATGDGLQRDPLVEPPEPDTAEADTADDSPDTHEDVDDDTGTAAEGDDNQGPEQPEESESELSTNGTDDTVDVEFEAETLLDADAEESGISITAPSTNGVDASSDSDDDESLPSPSDAGSDEATSPGDDTPAVKADAVQEDSAAGATDSGFDFDTPTTDGETTTDASTSPEADAETADTEPAGTDESPAESERDPAETDSATDLTDSIPDAVGAEGAVSTSDGEDTVTDSDDGDSPAAAATEGDVEPSGHTEAETEASTSHDDEAVEESDNDDDTDPEDVVDELFGGTDSTEDSTASDDDAPDGTGEDAETTDAQETDDQADDWDPDDIFSDADPDDEEANSTEDPEPASTDPDTTGDDADEDGSDEPEAEDGSETDISEDEPTDMEELVEDVFDEPGGD